MYLSVLSSWITSKAIPINRIHFSKPNDCDSCISYDKLSLRLLKMNVLNQIKYTIARICSSLLKKWTNKLNRLFVGYGQIRLRLLKMYFSMQRHSINLIYSLYWSLKHWGFYMFKKVTHIKYLMVRNPYWINDLGIQSVYLAAEDLFLLRQVFNFIIDKKNKTTCSEKRTIIFFIL